MQRATREREPSQAACRARKAKALLPRVQRIARAIAKQLPVHVDRDDVLGAAYLGLAEALENLGAKEEPSFESYALRRTRGAIVDELRAADVLTRTERTKLKRIHNAESRLSTALGRRPTDDEITRSLGTDEKSYDAVRVASVRRAPELLGDTEMPAYGEVNGVAESPESLLLERQRLERLAFGMGRLPNRLRHVIDLYYDGDRTLREIGNELGVSEARAYQLRQNALTELRNAAGPA